MPIVALNTPFLYLKIAEFLVGIVCYGLLFANVFAIPLTATDYFGRVCINFTQVTGVAYPFIILPAIFVCAFFQGEGFEKHFICPLLSLGGFLTSLIGGSCTCAKSYSGGGNAAGAICILLSFIFLGDVIYFAYQRFFKSPETVPQ